MSRARPSFSELAQIAEAAAGAADLRAGLETVATRVAAVLGTHAAIVEKRDQRWVLVAATTQWAAVLSPATGAALDGVASSDRPAVIRLDGRADDEWTALTLTRPGRPPVVLLLIGDWTPASDVLGPWAHLISYAMSVARERTLRNRAERLLVRGYSMARRLSRLGSVEITSQRIVNHVAELLKADRVALAVHRPGDDYLVIAATRGYPIGGVEHLRIEPGSWVIGHVYSTGRPLLVRDVRKIGASTPDPRGYRTYSFLAVPMFAGSETVGVLTATDKRDGSSFSRQEFMLLRAASVAAALTLVAARSQTEAGRLAYAATVDALTGLLNRTYFDGRLHQEFERARRGTNPLAVVMADVDNFKNINDRYGHQSGDAVLQVVGAVIRSAVRVFDVCARYGGDEFAILMPSSDHASAAACAERIRRRVAEYRGQQAGGPVVPSLTMSVGVAVIDAGDTPADLILRADRALYQAKAAGKNCVRVHPSGAGGRSLPPAGLNEKEPG